MTPASGISRGPLADQRTWLEASSHSTSHAVEAPSYCRRLVDVSTCIGHVSEGEEATSTDAVEMTAYLILPVRCW